MRSQRYQQERKELSENKLLLEDVKRDLKKVNVDPKQIIKKGILISKTKKENSRNEKTI